MIAKDAFFISIISSNFNHAGLSVTEKSEVVPRMDARFAEGLVRKWQNIKSQALGPDHCLQELPEVRNSLIFTLKSGGSAR